MSSNQFLNILYFLAGICILILIYIEILQKSVGFFLRTVKEKSPLRFLPVLIAFSVIAFFLFGYACFKLYLFIF